MNERIELREVTAESVVTICNLQVASEQRGFVAPNAISIAEAHFEPRAWFRAVYLAGEADPTPVGFVMLSVDDEADRYMLWRLMIAEGFQRRGYGKQVIDRVVEYIREQHGATALMTSYVPGEAGPKGFYMRLGFVDTGEIEDDEVVCRLDIEPATMR